ncbi:MAG: acyl-CoA desaturase [Pseudomonadota bacterium]
MVRWFDTDAGGDRDTAGGGVDWLRVFPFVAMHVTCLGVIWVGWSPIAVATAVLLYVVRMFAITGFYHRYFSHKAFKTSRPVQFLFGLVGVSAVQRGPLWWAAHHREHHRHSDTDEDVHSPVTKGFLTSHMGWFLSKDGYRVTFDRIKDLTRFPELKMLDRFDVFVPIGLAVALFLLGGYLERNHPGLGTSAGQMLIWGFFISTVVLFHATVTINSLAHRWGKRRFATRDNSRNNLWLALITFGEGWHNNHHHFPGSARQGFYWWEIDLTYYALKVMSWFGLVWDLKPVPGGMLQARRAS